MVEPGKSFQNRSSHMARKCYVEFGLKMKGPLTNLLSRIYRKCVRYSCTSIVYHGSTMVGPEEKFSKQRFSEGWKMLGDWFWQIQYFVREQC